MNNTGGYNLFASSDIETFHVYPAPGCFIVNPVSNRRLPLSRFGPDPLSFFNAVYEDRPPWDIGKPQAAMSALLARYPPTSPVLDVGCGSGDLSIYLAELGYETLGIDFVEAAIANAQEKIGSLPPQTARLVSFQVADALKPSLLGRQFGAIVDSGFFHLFDPDQCDRYVDELASTLRPGGLYLYTRSRSNFQSPACRARLLPKRYEGASLQRKDGRSRRSRKWNF